MAAGPSRARSSLVSPGGIVATVSTGARDETYDHVFPGWARRRATSAMSLSYRDRSSRRKVVTRAPGSYRRTWTW